MVQDIERILKQLKIQKVAPQYILKDIMQLTCHYCILYSRQLARRNARDFHIYKQYITFLDQLVNIYSTELTVLRCCGAAVRKEWTDKHHGCRHRWLSPLKAWHSAAWLVYDFLYSILSTLTSSPMSW